MPYKCDKCGKEFEIKKEAINHENNCEEKRKTCPNCGKKLGIFKTGFLYKWGDKRFCSIKCKEEYKNKLTSPKSREKGDMLFVKVNGEKRSLIGRIFLTLLGSFFILIGAFGILISIPLMLIIVGFFTGLGSMAILAFGAYIISNSKYKNVNINCPYCNQERIINPAFTNAFTCNRCQKRVLVEIRG